METNGALWGEFSEELPTDSFRMFSTRNGFSLLTWDGWRRKALYCKFLYSTKRLLEFDFSNSKFRFKTTEYRIAETLFLYSPLFLFVFFLTALLAITPRVSERLPNWFGCTPLSKRTATSTVKQSRAARVRSKIIQLRYLPS